MLTFAVQFALAPFAVASVGQTFPLWGIASVVAAALSSHWPRRPRRLLEVGRRPLNDVKRETMKFFSYWKTRWTWELSGNFLGNLVVPQIGPVVTASNHSMIHVASQPAPCCPSIRRSPGNGPALLCLGDLHSSHAIVIQIMYSLVFFWFSTKP